MSKSLASRVRTARRTLKITQGALDRAAGLCHGHTWAIEKGIRVDVRGDTLMALSRALGVSVQWLLTGSECRIARAS